MNSVADGLIDGNVVLRRWRSRGWIRFALFVSSKSFSSQKVAVCLSAPRGVFDH